MRKKNRLYILFLLLTILTITMFTFLLTSSWSPRDEEAPRRSRPVNAVSIIQQREIEE